MSVNKKKGLGRGLDALLGASNKNMASEFGGDNPSALPLNLLQAGKYQPRQIMDETPLKELADSIRERGVIQPLLVRPDRLPACSVGRNPEPSGRSCHKRQYPRGDGIYRLRHPQYGPIS